MSIKLRNFLITFAISLVLFSAVSFFVVSLILSPASNLPSEDTESSKDNISTNNPGDTSRDSETSEPNGSDSADTSDTTTEPVKAGESFTFMIVGTDYQPDIFDDYKITDEETTSANSGLPERGRQINADTILILRVNKSKRTFMFSALAPNMKTSVAAGVYTTLNDSFRKDGVEGLRKNVGALTGLAIDYYAVIGIADCVKILDLIDNISFNVPSDMYYEDPSQDLIIDLKKGVQTLTSAQALNMLRFNSYTTSTNSRLSVSIDFMKTVLTKVTQASYISRAGELYVQIAEYTDTNFASEDLISNLDLISSYRDFSKASVVYPVTSETHNGWEYLAPDLKSAFSKYLIYK